MSRAAKPLTREDIERAMRCTLSNRAAARYCRVSYSHYKRYAKLYKDENGVDLYTKHFNRGGKGIPKFALTAKPTKGRKEPPIVDIVEGRVSAEHFNPQKIKYRLIEMGMLEPACYVCGFNEKRFVDGKSPLILKHIDGNPGNWSLKNLRFVCYNHAFLEGSKDIPIDDEFIEKQEDFVDRNQKGEDKAWELDDYQRSFLEGLGIHPKEEKPYSKYISKI